MMRTSVRGYGTDANGKRAAVWQGTSGIRLLDDVLAAKGVTVPAGWTLTEATGVAVNPGIVSITGNATNADGKPEAWVARWCGAP